MQVEKLAREKGIAGALSPPVAIRSQTRAPSIAGPRFPSAKSLHPSSVAAPEAFSESTYGVLIKGYKGLGLRSQQLRSSTMDGH